MLIFLVLLSLFIQTESKEINLKKKHISSIPSFVTPIGSRGEIRLYKSQLFCMTHSHRQTQCHTE